MQGGLVSEARRLVVFAVVLALRAAADASEVDVASSGTTPPRAAVPIEEPVVEASAAAVPLAPHAAAAGPASLPEAIGFVWIDAGAAAPGTERSAREETLKLMRDMGVRASWRTGRTGEDAQPGELRVILLDRGAVDRSGSPVLGSTPSQFEGQPFFWVHVPSVRGALGLDPRRAVGPAELRDRHMLGIALGRVIAHETVHALAPGIPHSEGLMAPLLKRRDLTARSLAVPLELGRAFRAAVSAGSPGAPAMPDGTRLLTVGAERVDQPR